jgi:hypothetical protein
MFAIRFTDGMNHEMVYQCYSYSISRPSISNQDHPMITMALEVDITPSLIDPRAVTVPVVECAFIMNDSGKTIDRVTSYCEREDLEDFSVFKTSSEATVEAANQV